MVYQTMTCDDEGIQYVVDCVSEEINRFARRKQPFCVMTTTSPLDENVGDQLVTFHLAVTEDFFAKNERQAWRMYEELRGSLVKIQELNNANYVIAARAKRI